MAIFDYNPSAITPFPYWRWNKVLPAVYDDSVSQYEMLCRLLSVVNNIIESTNSTGEQVEALTQLVQQLIDGGFPDGLVDYINGIVDAAMADDIEAINDTLADMQEQIDAIRNTTSDFIGISNSSPFENLQQLYEVFLSWKAQEGALFYGAPSLFALDHNNDFTSFTPMNIKKTLVDGTYHYPMSCSVLTMCALMGITFERSRYANGIENTIGGIPYVVGGTNYPMAGSQFLDFENKTAVNYWQRYKADMSIDTASNAFYCSGLAHWLFDCGLLIPCTNNQMVNKCAPGDLLFYRNADENSNIFFWENLSHVDIFMGWNGNNQYNVLTSSGDTSVVNFTHRSITTELVTKLAYIARIPSAIPSPSATNMVEGDSYAKNLSFSGSGSHTFPRITFDNSGKLSGTGLHTIVMKLNNASGTNVRFNFYGAHTGDTTNSSQRGMIYLDTEGSYIGNNCYYCIYDERYAWDTIDTNVIGFRCIVNADSAYSVDIEEIRFYDYPIQPKPF